MSISIERQHDCVIGGVVVVGIVVVVGSTNESLQNMSLQTFLLKNSGRVTSELTLYQSYPGAHVVVYMM